MFKKTIIASAVIAASTGIAFANGGTFTPPAASSHSSRFYIGAAASHDTASVGVTQTSYQKSSTFYTEDKMQHDLFGHNWGWEIFGGYGIAFNNHYYLGAEGFWANGHTKLSSYRINTFTSSSSPSKEKSSLATINVKDSYGIDFVPGIILNKNTLLYSKIGWTRSRFSIRDGGVTLHAPEEPVSYFKKNVNGFQLGLGLEAMITKCFSIRGEYDWSQYNSIGGHSQPYTTQYGTKRYHNINSTHPHVGRFTLAGLLRFGGINMYSSHQEIAQKNSLSADHNGHFYMGAAASRSLANYNSTSIGKTVAYSSTGDTSTNNYLTKRNLGRHSWSSEIFGGYGSIFHDSYYMGVEGTIAIDTADSKHVFVRRSEYDDGNGNVGHKTIDQHNHTRINLKHSYGLSLIPGIMLTPNSMLYGRVGWVLSQFRLLFLKTGGSGAPVEIDLNKSKSGVLLGLGLEINATNKISLRGEYDWTKYCGSINARGTSYAYYTFVPNSIETTDSYTSIKIKHPEVTKFSIAAIYHFVS